jgi:hypothetical protein
MRYTPHDRQNRPRDDAYARDPRRQRPLSTTRRNQHVADGGTVQLPDPGDRVADRDGDGEDPLVVVATHPDTPASEYTIDGLDGATVAAVNLCYPSDSPVVEVVYAEAARRVVPAWQTVGDLQSAVDEGRLTAYTFPAHRLAPHSRAGEDLGGKL